MTFAMFMASQQGGRTRNEDRMGYCESAGSALFIVADGMGGHPEGDMAAQIALQSMTGLFQEMASPVLEDVPHFLESALLGAHRQILRYAIDREMDDSPRTTLVAAVIQQGELQYIHCGDSRLYLGRQGHLLARTRDHSYSELKDSALSHIGSRNRNVLFTCLGSPTRPIYDLGEPVVLERGDRLLLCSDGLWGQLEEHALPDFLIAGTGDADCHADLHAEMKALISAALASGGQNSDNVTAVAVEWQQAAAQARHERAGFDTSFADSEAFPDAGSDELLDDINIERSLSDIDNALRRK